MKLKTVLSYIHNIIIALALTPSILLIVFVWKLDFETITVIYKALIFKQSNHKSN